MHKDLHLLQIVKIISEYRNPVWNIVIVQSKNTHRFTQFLVSCWSYCHYKYTAVENQPECSEMHRESVMLSLSLFFYCFVLFKDRISLCNHGCPETHGIVQTGLEIRKICQTLLRECCD